MRRVREISAVLCLPIGIVLIALVLFLGACGGTQPVTTAAPSSSTSVTTVTSAGRVPPTTGSTAGGATTLTTGTGPASTGKSGEAGSKTNPIPLRTQAAVGDWKITVTSVELDADATLESAPGYQAPDSGNRYVLVNLDATYSGAYPDSFGNALGYQIVGSTGDTFDSAELGLSKAIENSDAITKGATVSGPLVFAVRSDVVDGATLWIAPASPGQETGSFFALK
jgi:hypothetical protein